MKKEKPLKGKHEKLGGTIETINTMGRKQQQYETNEYSDEMYQEENSYPAEYAQQSVMQKTKLPKQQKPAKQPKPPKAEKQAKGNVALNNQFKNEVLNNWKNHH